MGTKVAINPLNRITLTEYLISSVFNLTTALVRIYFLLTTQEALAIVWFLELPTGIIQYLLRNIDRRLT